MKPEASVGSDQPAFLTSMYAIPGVIIGYSVSPQTKLSKAIRFVMMLGFINTIPDPYEKFE